MSIEVKFVKNQNILEKEKIIKLFDGAFGETIYSNNTKTAFFTGYKSPYPNFVLLYKEKNLVGLAIIAQKLVRIFGHKVKTITVGPLAIGASHQNKGYSKYLFSGIDKIATKLNADLIYLQGIDNFYSKYEYFPCLAKSKLEIQVKHLLNIDQVTIIPFTDIYLKQVMDLYEQVAGNNNCTSYRSEQDWLWLTKYATLSYYFFKPYLIVDKDKDNVMGYFCTDPNDKSRLREAIYVMAYNKISLFLSGVKQYAYQNSLSSVEIMTPPDSMLVKYINNHSTGTFMQFIRSDGGQLVKIVNYKSMVKIIKKNMLYNSKPYSLSINGNNDNIYFSLTKNNTKNTIVTFKCKKKHLPGFITGYLGSEVFFDYNSSDQNHLEIFKHNPNNLSPFIYQGDNY